MNYEIYRGVDGFWWWRLFAANGRVVAHATQGHASAERCRDEIDLVKASAAAPVNQT